MTPHPKAADIWADMAAVREVREAFALEDARSPEEELWAKAHGVVLQFLNAGEARPGALYMLRGSGVPEPISVLLRRTAQGFAAVPEDDDSVGCWPPICDGESLMFSDDDRMACANMSCPNYDRWR